MTWHDRAKKKDPWSVRDSLHARSSSCDETRAEARDLRTNTRHGGRPEADVDKAAKGVWEREDELEDEDEASYTIRAKPWTSLFDRPGPPPEETNVTLMEVRRGVEMPELSCCLPTSSTVHGPCPSPDRRPVLRSSVVQRPLGLRVCPCCVVRAPPAIPG